ncbi:hypothetical protein [Streptomyces sp. NPDC086989]|uniref:hypothetical protein n=1 Tax=Streptomyces sp. NPDC086989 TaxID=3365764 RepID=UPI003820C9F4
MAGKPHSKLKGRTAEANALAVWLRDVTRARSLRQLEEEAKAAGSPFTRSSWGEVLTGGRLPTKKLIEAVVSRYVTTGRAERLKDGLELLEAAEQAQHALGDGALPSATPAGARLSPMAQAYKDLADAQKKHAEALQKLQQSEGQRRALEQTVSMLRAECTRLEVELEQAKEGRGELERELEQLREFRDRAGGQLEHARRLVGKAFTVQTAAMQKVIRDEAAVRALGGQVADTGVTVFTGEQRLPDVNELAQFLTDAGEGLEAQESALDELGEEFGLKPPIDAVTAASGPRVVPGQLVDEHDRPTVPGVPGHRQDSKDRQDNPVNSENVDSEQKDKQPLLHLLDSARTTTDVARAFEYLEEREGTSTQLSAAELAARAFGETPDAAQHWAVQVLRMGRGMPMIWEHLDALLTVLDPTMDESLAFERAYERVEKAYFLPQSRVPAETPPSSPSTRPSAAAVPDTPAEAATVGFSRAALVVGTIVVSVTLIIIGQLQRAGEDLTAAGRWFTGIGLGFFVMSAPLAFLVTRGKARHKPADPGDTDDQTYGYPPMV